MVETYVDGSFNETGVAGAVVIPSSEEELFFYTSEPLLIPYRNVSGEVLAALLAVSLAGQRSARELIVHHDYTGLAEWYSGRWKAKSPLARFFQEQLRVLTSSLRLKIEFRKVTAHAGNIWNTRADKAAKRALKLRESNVDIVEFIVRFKEYVGDQAP